METFNYKTTSQTILADLYTPVGVYMRLRDLYPQSALMESSDYHDQSNSRSFIGISPLASVAVGHGMVTINYPDGSTLRQELSATFGTAEAIHALIDRIKVEGDGAAVCGLFGYTSFNAVRYFENIDVKDETQAENDAPDMLYILYKVVIVFDHHNNLLRVVELTDAHLPELGADILKAMNRGSVREYGFHPVGDVRSTLTDEEHKANIRRGIQHCLRGDVFQIVLSRRFIQRYEGDDFKLYRALRSINPSPYLFYFDFGGFRILGSSPETHCRIEAVVPSASPLGSAPLAAPAYRAYIDPIAGTTRRTGDAEADRRGAEFLRNDPKENAEHVMLVLRDKLHGANLGGTTKSSGREGVDKCLDGVSTLVEFATDTADEVDDVRVVLDVLVVVDVHTVAVAAQVVAGQVDQHHVLGVLLRVVAQEFGTLAVSLGVARALRCAGNRVDVSVEGSSVRAVGHTFDAAVRLRRGAEDAETAEVEVEEVGRGIDAAQGAVEFEVITLVVLDETAREYNLEDVATQAVLDAPADIRLVLLVGQRARHVAYGMEVVSLDAGAVHGMENVVCGVGVVSVVGEGDNLQLVVVMVKDYHHLI